MNKRLSPLLPALLAGIFLLAAVAEAGDNFRLSPGISIGEIRGPGREQLTQALKKRTAKGPVTGILSGSLTLDSQTRREKETVPLEKPSGRPYQEYQPDPFTGRMWKYEVTPTEMVLNDYDLERFNGLMTFDWQLFTPAGDLTREGRLVLDLNRTRGGYLAAEGLVPPLRGGEAKGARNFEKRLADETVRLLTLDLGRLVTASELESASDSLSRKARNLARRGDWNGARDMWLELLGQNPAYGPALYNLGLYWEREKNPQKALEYYRQAFSSDDSLFHRQAVSRLTEALLTANRLPSR